MQRFLCLTAFDRSGTTFLGRYIQQKLPATFFIGELDKGIIGLLGRKPMKCSCGNTLAECSVWSGAALQLRSTGHHRKEAVKVVCENISEKIKPKLLVDSSKQLSHVRNVISVFHDNTILLHVVRNPKGIVWSRMKTRRERVLRGRHPRPGIASKVNLMMLYDSIAWSMTNIYIELFLKHKCKYYHKLIYEKAGRELPVFMDKYFGELLSNPEPHQYGNHVIFGNMNRFQDSGSIKIDDSWKTGLNRYQKVVVDLITLPVCLIFNYRF